MNKIEKVIRRREERSFKKMIKNYTLKHQAEPTKENREKLIQLYNLYETKFGKQYGVKNA